MHFEMMRCPVVAWVCINVGPPTGIVWHRRYSVASQMSHGITGTVWHQRYCMAYVSQLLYCIAAIALHQRCHMESQSIIWYHGWWCTASQLLDPIANGTALYRRYSIIFAWSQVHMNSHCLYRQLLPWVAGVHEHIQVITVHQRSLRQSCSYRSLQGSQRHIHPMLSHIPSQRSIRRWYLFLLHIRIASCRLSSLVLYLTILSHGFSHCQRDDH